MAEIESAELIAREYCDHPQVVASLAARIEANYTAIREAARLEGKRELLEELLAFSRSKMQQSDMSFGSGLVLAFYDAGTKYQSADSQPAQDGERRE